MNLSVGQKRYLLLLFAMLVCFAFGAFFEYFRPYSKISELGIEHFQKELHEKERVADANLQQMAQLVARDEMNGVKNLQFSDDEIAYYIFVGNALVYWSENKYDVVGILPQRVEKEQFLALKNFDFVAHSERVGDVLLLALIKIRNHFPYENDYVKNGFADGLHLNKNFGVVEGKPSDALAIVSASGEYLFSLDDTHVERHVPSAYLSLLFWCIGILLLFLAYSKLEWWFGKRIYRLRNFLLVFCAFFALLFVCLAFEVPSVIFRLELFSPVYYSAGGFMSSLGHIGVITLLLITSIYTFCFKIYFRPVIANRQQQRIWLVGVQAVSAAFFCLVMWMFTDLLENSTFNIAFFKLQDITFFSLVANLLIGVWFVAFVLFRSRCVSILMQFLSLRKLLIINFVVAAIGAIFAAFFGTLAVVIVLCYFLLCTLLDVVRYRSEKFLSYPALMLLVASFSLFVAWYSFEQGKQKRLQYYEQLSDLVFENKLTFSDLQTESVLAQLDSAIFADRNIMRYVALGSPSSARLTHYLSNYYLGRLGDEFDVKTVICPKHSEANCEAYYSEICRQGQSLAGTHFFYTYMLPSAFDYLGAFDFVRFRGDTVSLYIEISRTNKNSYSYPNRLFQSSEKQLPEHISAAKYTDSTLMANYGTFKYPFQLATLMGNSSKSVYENRILHTFFDKNDGNVVVVSELRLPDGLVFGIYAIYLLSGFLLIIVLGYSLWRHFNHQRLISTMFNRLLRSLMIFFVIGITLLFVVIGYLYVRQSKKMLEQERHLRLEYVKNALAEAFADDDVLTESKVNSAFILSDLANTLETDIHLYNLDGALITTSRTIVFLNEFTSRFMNPDVYFHDAPTEDIRVSESIGDLRYTASYSSLRNAKGELLAYIAVPTFESLLNFREEMFNVMAVIVFIYLILVLLSIFVCYLLAKGISRPMKSLEEKLKNIHFGKKNEKIEYKSDKMDEIAQLITQYNNMVDELAYSADMLAKTEREQAWKQMARQIAHEIKNPLTPMKLTVQQLQRMKKNNSDKFDAYFDKTAEVLIEEIDNLSRISTEFSDFARMPETELSSIDLTARLISIVELFRNNYGNLKVEFTPLSEEVIILADKTQITQIFNNLLLNATQSIPVEREGVITVSMNLDEEFVTVAVADNGCGVSDEDKERIFLPNFTTKSSGMGLGLAIVKNLVIMLNGEISFVTAPDEGTTFFVKFPLQKTT